MSGLLLPIVYTQPDTVKSPVPIAVIGDVSLFEPELSILALAPWSASEYAPLSNKDIGDLIKSLKQKQQIMLKISNGEERHDTNYALENMFDVNEILMFEPCTDYQKAKK